MKRVFYLKQLFTSLILVFTIISVSGQQFNKNLQKYCELLVKEMPAVANERQLVLNKIASQIVDDMKRYSGAQPLFICTHNSRRSQMAQLWLYTAAEFYGIDSVIPYSGGIEVTAFNENAVKAMNRSGFTVISAQYSNQKAYIISTGKSNVERLMYSKKYDDQLNPKKDFFAIMVCSDADKSCPNIPGADARFSLPYEDPRYYDNTPSEKTKYDETCRLIAREMFYIMEHVKMLLNKEAESKKN